MMHFPPVVAGCMNWGQWGARFTTNQYQDMIHRCLDMGIDWFDHADIYGHYTTEEEFGHALAKESGLRQKIKLVTKCGIKLITPNRPEHVIKSYDTSAGHIIASVDRSLQYLHTDHIDLLLIHRPSPLMDAAEVAEAVDRVKTSGKVLHFGVSNFLPHHMELLRSVVKIEANQYEVSAFHTKPLYDGTMDYCQKYGIASMSWSPLGGGILAKDKKDEKSQRVCDAAEKIGKPKGVTIEQVLLAWLHRHPARPVPVVGTTKPDRIEAARDAQNITLTAEEWFTILEAHHGHEVP